MSTLKDKIAADMRQAMKARDKFVVGVLRQVLGEIATQEKAGSVAIEFNDAMVRTILRREVKKRHDTAEIYREAGHIARSHEETREADLLDTYLPTLLSEEQVKTLIEEQIVAQGATTMQDMGKVIEAVIAAAEGRVVGRTVFTLVKARLG